MILKTKACFISHQRNRSYKLLPIDDHSHFKSSASPQVSDQLRFLEIQKLLNLSMEHYSSRSLNDWWNLFSQLKNCQESNQKVYPSEWNIKIFPRACIYWKNVIHLSPQTPTSVWKLEGWNFAIRFLKLRSKKWPTRFLKFCLGAEIWRFFYF